MRSFSLDFKFGTCENPELVPQGTSAFSGSDLPTPRVLRLICSTDLVPCPPPIFWGGDSPDRGDPPVPPVGKTLKDMFLGSVTGGGSPHENFLLERGDKCLYGGGDNPMFR